MANLNEIIKEDQAIWKKTQRLIDAVQCIGEHPDHELAQQYVLSGSYLRVTIAELSDLSKMRKILRESFGTWSDKVANKFISCGSFITTWKGKGVPVEIWYFCSPDDIPAKLQKPGCKVIETTRTEQEYVCDINGDSQ